MPIRNWRPADFLFIVMSFSTPASKIRMTIYGEGTDEERCAAGLDPGSGDPPVHRARF
ncbi:hypothetical protein CO2235_MP60055 [Cupriavidus oxalaticus]|uniref:Uncharacterized protein n=1 Tax=Cupriavidus oxalaticus TaxID=96344 RepID=A0A375GG46_9BURK|nr:hypothetical protein CO2235_MP60055 [Cupriavidus oxalaticus]